MTDIQVTEDQMLSAVRDAFEGKYPQQPLRRVLYAIYVQQETGRGRRDAEAGLLTPHHKVMDEMWQRINTKSSGHKEQS